MGPGHRKRRCSLFSKTRKNTEANTWNGEKARTRKKFLMRPGKEDVWDEQLLA